MHKKSLTWRTRPPFAFLFVLLIVGSIGCPAHNDSSTDQPSGFSESTQSRRVVAVSYPLAYLTQRIASDAVSVEYPAVDADNARTWAPTIKQIESMQNADLIVTNQPGADFAEWLVRVSLSESTMCHSCELLKTRSFIAVEDYRIVHNHGPEGEHSHPYMVAHTWLDPEIAKQQAAMIYGRLCETYPESVQVFKSGHQELVADLDGLTERLSALKPVSDSEPGLAIVSTVPSFKFLTRAAGMLDTHLLWFESPTVENWESEEKTFQDRVAQANAQVILWPKKPSTEIATRLEALGYESFVIDVMDRKPSAGNYLTVMRRNIEVLESIVNQTRHADSRPAD